MKGKLENRLLIISSYYAPNIDQAKLMQNLLRDVKKCEWGEIIQEDANCNLSKILL